MHRKDIQLLASARGGNPSARYEAGKRYILGTDGFQRHVTTGLDYFKNLNVQTNPEILKVLAEGLSLPELVEHNQIDNLQIAADSGNGAAQFKLGIWKVLREPKNKTGICLLLSAQESGYITNKENFQANEVDTKQLAKFFLDSGFSSDFDGLAVLMLATRELLKEANLMGASRCLDIAFQLSPKPSDEMADLVFTGIRAAEEMGRPFTGLPVAAVQACLERRCGRLDYSGAYILGRALCAIACGQIAATDLVQATNYRKGVALLLRAASDEARTDAWLYLHRLHSNKDLSVANPEMARFCLEKAAVFGKVLGQRKLGAAILRESNSLVESERGIEWLFKASAWDSLAADLLTTLVFPVKGLEADAKAAIEEVGRTAPWLAVRLQISRAFGLTKLEALTVDLVAGEREWGLVVGPNPFSFKTRISAPRAVPALSSEALVQLRSAAVFFAQLKSDGNPLEGDLRHRAMTQRTAFKRHHLSEGMFFAQVTSSQLDGMRLGSKWAHRVKNLLSVALADEPCTATGQWSSGSRPEGDTGRPGLCS